MKSMSKEQQVLDSLKAELAEINAILKRVPDLEKRRNSLLGSPWANSKGEIYRAELALFESDLPIFEPKTEHRFSDSTRIVAVDSKWISIKTDGSDKKYITRYKISNGWPERSRDGRGAIDVKKALSIWNEHQDKTI